MITRRSAIQLYQKCPRARFLQYELRTPSHQPTDLGGVELVKQSVPLVTGSATHIGLSWLLEGGTVEDAVAESLSYYDEMCDQRGLQIGELEDSSFTYRQQRALIEALIRLGHLRLVPALLAKYEILEVERPGQIGDFAPSVQLNYRPDALMRMREDGDLYILSWKTAASYTKLTIRQFETDMQQLSETWAREADSSRPLRPTYGQEKVRGVQMAYLIKGRKTDYMLTPELKVKRLANPLIWGQRREGFPPLYAAGEYWTCSAPHPMRKGKWYPTGQCEGNGRRHKRGDEWKEFGVWGEMGVGEWMRMIQAGEVADAQVSQSPLDTQWVLPVPLYRNQERIKAWQMQTSAQEERIAKVTPSPTPTEMAEVFPQYGHTCNTYYGGQCPAYEICWGPSNVGEDPIGSGLYTIRSADASYIQEETEME